MPDGAAIQSCLFSLGLGLSFEGDLLGHRLTSDLSDVLPQIALMNVSKEYRLRIPNLFMMR